MTIEFSDKPLDLLKNYTKTIEDVVPGIYLGVIVDRVDDGGYASVKVKIPQLDGDIPDADAPSAIVMYGYAGIGYGINYPLTIGEPVIVGVLVEVGVRIILGRFYTEGALPDLFSDPLVLGGVSGGIMAFGGMTGDMVGSFIKRRSGIPRGKTFIFLDQLGFLVLGMLFVFPLIPWPIEWLLFLVPITFLTHIAANLFGYFTGLQDDPL